MNRLKIAGDSCLEAWMNGIVDLGRYTDSNSTARFFINFISNNIIINQIKLFRIEFSSNKSIMLYDYFSPVQCAKATPAYRDIILTKKQQIPYILNATNNTKTLIFAPIKTLDKQQLLLEINLDKYIAEDFIYLPFLVQAFVNQINLVDLNSRDSLTGLLNQRNYNEKIEQYVSLYDSSNNRREQTVKHCLAVADLDHFKRINNQYGHLFGDDILIHIAHILKESFRDRDLIFRYSGEKFTIIIHEVSVEVANNILERLRSNIIDYEFPLDIKISVSIGFTLMMGATPDVLFDHAEKALYYAKENGRNKVCLYEDLKQQGLLADQNEDDSNIDFF